MDRTPVGHAHGAVVDVRARVGLAAARVWNRDVVRGDEVEEVREDRFGARLLALRPDVEMERQVVDDRCGLGAGDILGLHDLTLCL